ncbi:MAG: hypothetical protein R3351_03260 [Nitrospirales bacterium]|nr:hypothetical protein [Nitrospirales bacterium]
MPATIFVVIGYFVLYFSTKVQGTVHRIGRGLALWIFFMALFFPMIGAYVTLSGHCPIVEMIKEMERINNQ